MEVGLVVLGVGKGVGCDVVHGVGSLESCLIVLASDVAGNAAPVAFGLWESIARTYALPSVLTVAFLSAAPTFE